MNKLQPARTAWQLAASFLFKSVPLLTVGIGYSYYLFKNHRIRCDTFKNKSRLFGGLKNPQY